MFNQRSQARLPMPRCSLSDLTRECASRFESATALVHGDLRLDFIQLDAAAQSIARELQLCGVKTGDHVVIMGPHSATQVAVILGVAALGAVSVPLDPALPAARARLLLVDAQPRVIVAPHTLPVLLEHDVGTRVLPWNVAERHVRSSARGHAPYLTVQPDRPIRADDVAYIIYTSGTTGAPKGVQIEQRAVAAFFETYNANVGISAGDRCLNTGAFHFDVSVLDIFLPLYFGATVYIGARLPLPSLFLHELSSQRITHFYAVGTFLSQVTGDGSSLDRHDLRHLRVLQTGAEVCKPAVINEWLRRLPELRFIHSYGPTEVTVGCIQYRKPQGGALQGERCPIGTPHAGTVVLLIDRRRRIIKQPEQIGELLLGGAQMMRGYWNAPSATRRAFITLEGQRYYRSGDLAYRDASGAYWFVGRRDDQIKFLGHRVHLRELSDALTRHPAVCSAAAGVVHVADGREQLAVVAQLSTAPSATLVQSLRQCAKEQLPSAIVPGVLGLVRCWPRLPSGKADTARCLRELAEATARHGRGAYVREKARFEPLARTTTRGPSPWATELR